MSIDQIWEVAGALIITAVVCLIVGMIIIKLQGNITPGLIKNLMKMIALLLIIAPLLFLQYTLIRAIIFLFFLS